MNLSSHIIIYAGLKNLEVLNLSENYGLNAINYLSCLDGLSSLKSLSLANGVSSLDSEAKYSFLSYKIKCNQ
jgi:hypothetical protein